MFTLHVGLYGWAGNHSTGWFVVRSQRIVLWLESKTFRAFELLLAQHTGTFMLSPCSRTAIRVGVVVNLSIPSSMEDAGLVITKEVAAGFEAVADFSLRLCAVWGGGICDDEGFEGESTGSVSTTATDLSFLVLVECVLTMGPVEEAGCEGITGSGTSPSGPTTLSYGVSKSLASSASRSL